MAKRKAAELAPARPRPKRPRNSKRKPAHGVRRDYEDILNYNIRMMVYDYLSLVPFSAGTEGKGIALSCRAAFGEIREAAAHRLRTRIARFQRKLEIKTSFEAHLSPILPRGSWKELTNITITLPPAAMEAGMFMTHLRPLFTLYLDKLFIMFKGDAHSARNSLSYGPPSRLGCSIFTRVNTRSMPWLQQAENTVVGLWCHIDERCNMRTYQDFPHSNSVPFRTKHIAMGWDFRDQDAVAAGKGRRRHLMEGKLFRHSKDFMSYYKRPAHLPDDFVWPFRYELMGKGGLVGAWGFVSENRWQVYDRRSQFFHVLHWKCMGKKVGSDDFGDSLVMTG